MCVCVFLKIYVDFKYGYIDVEKTYMVREKNNFFQLVRRNVVKRKERKIVKSPI